MPVKKVLSLQTLVGLKEDDVPSLQKEFGKNVFKITGTPRFFIIIWDIVREPVFILLCLACALYFVMGEAEEGFLMLAAMLFVAAISVYQEVKSFKAMQALQYYTEPKVIVIRNGVEKSIASSELVPGDIILLEEGNKVPADAT